MKNALILALAFTSSFLPSASAQEWPRFRGPNGSGINPKADLIPPVFTDKDYRWQTELPGGGTSSPALWGNQLFLTSEAENGNQRVVLCFDVQTGKPLWKYDSQFTPHPHHRDNNFASSTPAVDASQLYVAWTSGQEMKVLALTHEGKKSWETSLGFFQEEHGSGASPVLAGGVLIVSKDHNKDDAFIAGLDVKTGKVLWKTKRQTARSSFSSPIVVEEPPTAGAKARTTVLFNSNPKALMCLDAADGKVLWDYTYSQKSEYRAVGSPTYADGIYFATVGQGNGGKDCVALRLKDGKPEVAWELKKGLPYVPTPLGDGPLIYLMNDTGILTCVRSQTGEVVYNERLLDSTYSSPVRAGDKIICISRKGEVAIVKAGEKFEVLGRSQLNEPCESTPAIAQGTLFLRTAKRLIAVGGARPQAKNSHRGGGLEIVLVSEMASIQPGKSFTVGLRVRHEAGRHTYWKNPGLAGVKFGLDWSLPAGWSVGTIHWPPPDKVRMAGIRTHGYEHDIMLMVELTPAATLPPAGAEISLPVKVSWMCCGRDSDCRPGCDDLALTVPVGETATPANPEVLAEFAAARALLPHPTAAWKYTATRHAGTILFTAEPATSDALDSPSPEDPIFFADNMLVCSHELQKWSWNGHGYTAELPVSQFAPEGLKELTGLAYSPIGWHVGGKDRYVEVKVTLQ